MSIKPTVGRVVWFYPSRTESAEFSQPAAGEPLAAVIAAVLPGHPIDIVNLAVFDATGTSHPCTLVPLIQAGQAWPRDNAFATWMPYQVEQAKKAEAKLEAMSAGNCSATAQIIGATGFGPERERFDMLSLALRTPGVSGCREVLAAAKAYRDYIDGDDQQPPSGAGHPGHTGYGTMLPHQNRVADELAQLQDRLSKLIAFTGTTIFASLDDAERKRLDQQVACMTRYADILGERIAAAKSA